MSNDSEDQRARRPEDSPFNRSVFDILDQVEYRVCNKGEDLEAIYRLRYGSYRAAGMVKTDAAKQVHDEYDDLPNAYCFGVYYREKLVSTLRLHHLTRENPIAPSCSVFGDIINSRVNAGQTMIDPSRFAADADAARSLRVLPYITLRLAVLGAKHFDTDYCMIAIKEEHSAFYYRVFRAEPATGARTYPGIEVPVHLLQMNTKQKLDSVIERFPFFRYSAAEQRMLFDRPKSGEVGSLTVLPTARQGRSAA